jgi:hypothetical protein
MHIKKIFGKALTLLAIPVLLVSCGGGGGGGAADATVAFNMTITVDLANLLSNEGEVTFEPGTQFASGFSVRLSRNDGSAVPATAVSVSVNNASLALLSTVADPNTQSGSLELTTSAGIVNGIIHTRDLTGTVQLVASAFDVTAGTTVTRTAVINIAQGPEPIQRVTIESTRTSLPANRFNFPILIPGSPYIATVTLRFRNADGVLISPQNGTFGVSISPVTLAAFSTLDDPETEEINETLVLIGNGPVSVAGGEGTIFVHAFDTPGTVRLSVTAQDPNTLENFDNEFEIEIVEPASDGLPANVALEVAPGPQYIQGSGGLTAREFGIIVLDGAGVPVPDTTNGNNNIVQIPPMATTTSFWKCSPSNPRPAKHCAACPPMAPRSAVVISQWPLPTAYRRPPCSAAPNLARLESGPPLMCSITTSVTALMCHCRLNPRS